MQATTVHYSSKLYGPCSDSSCVSMTQEFKRSDKSDFADEKIDGVLSKLLAWIHVTTTMHVLKNLVLTGNMNSGNTVDCIFAVTFLCCDESIRSF